MNRPEQLIKEGYNNQKNFMTPDAIEYGWITENLAYEISSGEGLTHNTIYGLSIVKRNDDRTATPQFDLSGCFDSLEEVKERIKELKNQ